MTTNVSEAARALVRLARGVPKNFSKAEIERRKKRLAEARKIRMAQLKAAKKGKR